MLNIWSIEDRRFVDDLCRLHGTLSSEYFDSRQIEAYRATICPYEGYDFIRLHIKPHVLKRAGEPYTIAAQSVSYVLLARNAQSAEHKLIPLQENAESLYTIDILLGQQITPVNVVSYVTFFGHICNRPPFYFFDKLAHIDSLVAKAPPSQVAQIRDTVLGAFQNSDGDQLNIHIATDSHVLLGKYLSLRMPCLFRGHLYITRLRVSTAGVPRMDHDDELNIQGMFDEEENLLYYPLDSSPALSSVCTRISRGASRPHRIISWTLTADTVLQWLLLPLFTFQLFILFAFGLSDATIHAYFERLQDSRTLTFLCLLLGIAGTAIAVFRYSFVELLLYVRRFVPSVWSAFADKVEEQSRLAARGLGLVKLTILSLLEFSLRTVMALTLLLYGLANLRLHWLPAINFGQAAMGVIMRIPLIGSAVARLIGPSTYTDVPFSPAAGATIQTIVGFLFSTIIVGLVLRQVSLARSKAQL